MRSARSALVAGFVLVALSSIAVLFLQGRPTAISAITLDDPGTVYAAVGEHESLSEVLAPPVRDAIAVSLRPDEEPVEKAPTSGRVQFIVSDQEGEPVADAILTVSDSGRVVEHQTGPEGSVDLTPPAVAGALISASAAGYSVEYAHPGEHPHPIYRLTLKPGASIRGQLAMVDGEPVPTGVRVCAFRQQQTDLDDRNLPSMAKLGRGCSTAVEADGTFCIEGLEDGEYYRVSAYGGGVVLAYNATQSQCVAPEDSLELVAHYLGAADFQLDEADSPLGIFAASLRHELPDTSNGLDHVSEYSCHVEWKGKQEQLPGSLLSIGLAGLSVKTRYDVPGLRERVYIKAKTRADAAASGTLEWQTPFAELVSVKFTTALATDKASIPVVAVPLPTLPGPWTPDAMGSLEIAFHAPWLQEGPSSSVLQASVRLRPTSSPHGQSLTLRADWDRSAADGAGAFTIPGVPEGRYEAWLFEASTKASFPDRQKAGWTVEIQRGERSLIDATHCEVAAVQLDLVEATGEPFERGLSIDLLVKSTAGRGYTCLANRTPAFISAPYILPFVPIERVRGKKGLFALPHNGFVFPRPALLMEEDLTPGQLHRVRLDLQELPRTPEGWAALAQ